MKKLLFLVGTRPEVIKIAPLFRLCREKGSFLSRLCCSGQHSSMLKEALTESSLTPDQSFTVYGDLLQKTAECLLRFGNVLACEEPHAVLVHGDTLTAFSGALAAFYRGIPVLHVEAGLRTDTPFSPFPEELYRRTVDDLSTLCFAPTPLAEERLLREGKPKECVFTVGNTVVDGLLEDIDPRFSHPALKEGERLVLLTVHRRESAGEPLKSICLGVRDALTHLRGVRLFSPVHPNPAVGQTVREILSDLPAVTLTAPLGRKCFRNLLFRAALVLTDSGGVSEEATALGVPTLLLRDETERTEGVAAGTLFPVGRERARVAAAVCDFLNNPRTVRPSDAFGDGHASERILSHIEAYFSKTPF